MENASWREHERRRARAVRCKVAYVEGKFGRFGERIMLGLRANVPRRITRPALPVICLEKLPDRPEAGVVGSGTYDPSRLTTGQIPRDGVVLSRFTRSCDVAVPTDLVFCFCSSERYCAGCESRRVAATGVILYLE